MSADGCKNMNFDMDMEQSCFALLECSSDSDDSGMGMDFDDSESDTKTIKTDTFTDPREYLGHKRDRDQDFTFLESSKRQKTSNERKLLTKSLSFGHSPEFLEEDVFTSLNRVLDRDDVIADGSSYYKLPTISGRHKDLKTIGTETMRNILQGRYTGIVDKFLVVDCRYPFEYDGGHVQGSVNLHTQEQITEFMMSTTDVKPDIIIFHCEFSSERGPKLCRFLRSLDRRLNGERYPQLFYPEVYILDGGYKEFFYQCKEFCLPRNYVPMLHEDYTDEVRHFRSKSRSMEVHRRKCPQRLF